MPVIYPHDLPIEISTNRIAQVAMTERENCSRSRFRSALCSVDPTWKKASISTDRWYHKAVLYRSRSRKTEKE